MRILDQISPFVPLFCKKCLGVSKKNSKFFPIFCKIFIKIELAFWQDVVVKVKKFNKSLKYFKNQKSFHT